MQIYGKSKGKGREGKGKGPRFTVRVARYNHDDDDAEYPEPSESTDPGSFLSAMRALDTHKSDRKERKPIQGVKTKKKKKSNDDSWAGWLSTSLFGGEPEDSDSSSSCTTEEDSASEQTPPWVRTAISKQKILNAPASRSSSKRRSGKSFMFDASSPAKGGGLPGADDSCLVDEDAGQQWSRTPVGPSPRPRSRTTSDGAREASTATRAASAAPCSPSRTASSPSVSAKSRVQPKKSAMSRLPIEKHASHEEASQRSPGISTTSPRSGARSPGVRTNAPTFGRVESEKLAMSRSPSEKAFGRVQSEKPAMSRSPSEKRGQGGDRSSSPSARPFGHAQTEKPTMRKAPSGSPAMQRVASDRFGKGNGGKGNFKGQNTLSPAGKAVVMF